MMIACITLKCSLVPLMAGLSSSNPYVADMQLKSMCIRVLDITFASFAFLFRKEKYVK